MTVCSEVRSVRPPRSPRRGARDSQRRARGPSQSTYNRQEAAALASFPPGWAARPFDPQILLSLLPPAVLRAPGRWRK